MVIKKENIKKIRKHRYIDNNSEYNNVIHKMLIVLLMNSHVNANDNEVLILLQNETYKYEISSNNSETSVNMSNKMVNALLDNQMYSYTAIHNHPNGETFSLLDVVQLIKYDKLNALILIDNECKNSYAMFKNKNSRMLKITIRVLEVLINNQLLSGHSSGVLITKIFKSSLKYKEYKNY